MTYKITIRTRNKMIPVNNRIIRTPAEFYIPESKLQFYKNLIHHESINDYEINNEDRKQVQKIKPEIIKEESKSKKQNLNFRKSNKTLDKYF